MNNELIIERLEYVISLGIEVSTLRRVNDKFHVPYDKYVGFRAPAMSLLNFMFKDNDSYFIAFNKSVYENSVVCVNAGIEILRALRFEVSKGWLYTVRELITAEVFGDFLEMSKYLLDEGYKDASAVMIGSVLEEHLRQLCNKNSIEISFEKLGKIVFKKAEVLNADLVKANVYKLGDQKSVTAWLDIRNNAAHGKYTEYTQDRVELMYEGVNNFITRIS